MIRAILLSVGLVTFLSVTPALRAQDVRRDLRESQLRLDSIRAERARLQKEMTSLQSRVRDASRELANIGRQRAASASALQELELQTNLLGTQADQISAELETTRDRLNDRTQLLRNRLRSIYKRGPLSTVRVLLTAESFADLLSRYKYLHLITLRDRMMVQDVRTLEQQLVGQEQLLRQNLTQLDNLRFEKQDELARFQRIEGQNRRVLTQYKTAQSKAASQLEKAEKDEARLSGVIDRLERERRDAERRRASAGAPAVAGTITTRDLGSLNWPVEGRVIYDFGPVRKPNGVTLINKGIGIAAPVGTPVKAVEAGVVSLARPFEGYGQTVMVDHGGGYYTLYMFLNSIVVKEGQHVESGQQVGTVGGARTPEGPHLYFQVRAPLRGDLPEAVDPLTWLRGRASGR